MTRYMYDSTTLGDIPSDAQMVAVYGSGDFRMSSDLVSARFPHAVKVYIDVNGTAPACTVRDWEPGDEEGSLESWVILSKRYNARPTIYCDRADIARVRQETGSQVLGKDYWLWVATLDGSWSLSYPDAPAGSVVAVQYQGMAQTGIHADRSIVFDPYWPVFKPAAVPVPVAVKPVPPVKAAAVTVVRVTATLSDGTSQTWYNEVV
jgi:hypothetical protein